MASERALSEHVEQKSFVFFARKLIEKKGLAALLFAIPNGGARGIVTASRLKDEGVLAGIPDLMFAYPAGGFHGLFLEMKRCRGGRVSESQKEVMRRLEEAGYRAVVCRGALEAEQALEDYLRDEGGISLLPSPDAP